MNAIFSNRLKNQIASLIEVFQCAILELSAKLEDEKATISARDRESAEYVVGMAQVSSVNLLKVMNQGAAFYEANKEKANRLIAEATAFADSLKAEGYGLQ